MKIRKWLKKHIIPIKSEGILPSQNLPVGIWSTKSIPYGGKSHLTRVLITLLFPGSTMESPNTIIAGTNAELFSGFCVKVKASKWTINKKNKRRYTWGTLSFMGKNIFSYFLLEYEKYPFHDIFILIGKVHILINFISDLFARIKKKL